MIDKAGTLTTTRSTRISADAVVRAAVDVTRTVGLGGLTLRAVAGELGVQSPSLYHHVPGGLEDLQARVVEAVIAEFESELRMLDDPSESPWQRMERPLRVLGRITEDYPGVLQHILTTGRDRPHALASAEQTVRELMQSELGPVTPTAWVLVHTFVTGWAFAQRPSSAAARTHGFPALGDVLTQAESVGDEAVLFEGLRALLAGLLAGTRQPGRELPLDSFLR